jgi:hypothetical protein
MTFESLHALNGRTPLETEPERTIPATVPVYPEATAVGDDPTGTTRHRNGAWRPEPGEDRLSR